MSRASFPAQPSRRLLLSGAGAGLRLAACGQSPSAAPQASLTVLRDRPVRAPGPDGKLSIDDARFLIALALIHPDPVSVLAAWGGDINRISPETHRAFVAKFPALESLPRVAQAGGQFDLEAILAARPAVAVVSLGAGPTEAQAQRLEDAGVSVAYIDFFDHPFRNQARSLLLLGDLTGRREQAEAFNAFRKARLDVIAQRVAGLPAERRPTVFLEPHAMISPDCCNSPGRGNIGEYIEFVGGRNIGADVLTQSSGKLNLEYVVQRDPDVYIATGGPHLERAGGFVTGPGYTPEQSQAGLRRVSARRGITTLKAVREGRVHGLSHQLINSPIDVVAAEVLARWIHPELFADLNPRDTLDQINRQFLAVPYVGDYWADLAAA